MMKRVFKSIFQYSSQQSGITLLLVILVLSGLMTVSLSIFNVSFIELRISGDFASSLKALNAADELVELTLYKDRVQQSICESPGASCYVACINGSADCESPNETFPILASGACGKVTLSRLGGQTTLQSVGQFDCSAGSFRVVRRSFMVIY